MTVTNLLTNMVVLMFSGRIEKTNPLYERYAIKFMLTNAQAVAAKFDWDTNLIARNTITGASIHPNVYGLSGTIEFAHQYGFSFHRGALAGCADWQYDQLKDYNLFEKHDEKAIKKWLSATNLLNAESAKTLAYSAMRSMNLDSELVGRTKPTQTPFYELIDGNSEYLPFYTFSWDSLLSDEVRHTFGYTNLVVHQTASVTISGLNKKVINFSQDTPYRHTPNPTNFLKLLGMPTNTVFVKPLQTIIGQPNKYEVLP